jgi:hypothetical protein
MQTDPTARHSPIGSFQRVCYLVHLARDGRMAAASGTRPPALHPDRRRARWEGANRGRGRPVRCRTIPEGVRGKARSPSNSAASTAPPPSSAQPGRRCARPSPATASACPPQPRSRPPAGHRRRPPAQRPAGRPAAGPGVCCPQPACAPGAAADTGGASPVGPPRRGVRHPGRQRRRGAEEGPTASDRPPARLEDDPGRSLARVG